VNGYRICDPLGNSLGTLPSVSVGPVSQQIFRRIRRRLDSYVRRARVAHASGVRRHRPENVAAVIRDRELAQRMLEGHEAAFDEFFDTYFPPLFRFAVTRMEDDAGAAEEVVQSALCLAVRRIETYRGEAALFTWLCTICRHEIGRHYRRLQRTPPALRLPEDTSEVRAVLDSLAVDDAGPETEVRRKEVGRLVRVALDHLPPHYSRALEWKYLDGLAVDEIARRLDLSGKAAESLLTRARDAFREAFAALCGGRSAAEAEAMGE